MWVTILLYALAFISTFVMWELVNWVFNTNNKIKELQNRVDLLSEYKNFQEKNNTQVMQNFKDVDKKLTAIDNNIENVNTVIKKKTLELSRETKRNKFSVLPMDYQDKRKSSTNKKKTVRRKNNNG
jgi:hypothetical protein